MGIRIALPAIGCPQRYSEGGQAHVHTYFCSVPSLLVVCLVAWGLRVRFCRLLASPRVVCVCGPSPDPPSFLEHLHKHQGSVLHPDCKTAFPSFEDALHRLLPYHVYQGALPSPHDYHKGEASPGCGGGR